MAQLSRDGLKQLLQTHVVEIFFVRRNEKMGFPPTRRMLTTLDKNLLLSLPGRFTLNYQVPTHPPAYNPVQHNVIFTWDIIWQSWRAIPVEWVRVLNAMPTHTQKDQEKFWKFFEGYLAKMSPMDKLRFMKS
jgi:hypothetical protein